MFFIHWVNNKRTFKKQAGVLVSLFFLFALSSCSNQDEIVASVNKKDLHHSEAELLMDHLGYDVNNKNDWRQFLDNWTKNQVLKQELDNADPEQARLIELKSEEYRGELSRYYLEEKAIMQKLDTSVSEEEILNYYRKNQSSFALQDYLVKALYIKIPKGVKVEEKLKSAYLLKNDKDLSQVNSYAKLYAENFYFDDEQWIYFTELTKDIPLKQYNKDNIVLNRTKTYFSDDEFTYYLNIIDYRLKDETPPLEFLRTQIKEIILSGRVSKLREELGNSFYQKIQKKHDVKIYYN